MTPPDDRTTKARIRYAAIECIAADGVAAATTRKVAARAGVSPGSIIHHFGSMDGLRAACDEHVAAVVRSTKAESLAAGPALDLAAVLRRTEIPSITAYLAEVLTEDSPAVAALVDDLVSDAAAYLQEGVESGMLKPSADPRGRAAVLAMWSLGALALHHHVERLFGVDPTDPDLAANPAVASYMAPGYEILGEGLFTEEAAGRLQATIAALAAAGDAADASRRQRRVGGAGTSEGTP